jgi:hypothetical protein
MPEPGSPPPADFREQMQTLTEKTTTNVEAVLTPDQKKLLPEFLKTAQALRATGIPMEVYADLHLTADQKTQLVAISDKSTADMRQKMEDAQANGGGDRQAMFEMFRTAREDTHNKAMAVLSADQKAKVDAYVAAHPAPQFGGFGGGGGRRGGGGGFGGPPPGQ